MQINVPAVAQTVTAHVAHFNVHMCYICSVHLDSIHIQACFSTQPLNLPHLLSSKTAHYHVKQWRTSNTALILHR